MNIPSFGTGKVQKLERRIAELEAVAQARPKQGEIGTPGTELLGGYIVREDHKDEFNNELGIDIYDEMIRVEPILKGLLNVIKMPIMSQEARIDPASDDNEDMEIAEEVEDNLFNNSNFTYSQWLGDVLQYLTYGFVVLEKTFEVIDGRYRWKKFAYRKPGTIRRWFVKESMLDYLEQDAIDANSGRWRTVDIPQHKVFHIAHEMQGLNFRGISVLRPAYRAFKMKDDIVRRMAIQSERGAVGIPKITYKQGDPGAATKEKARAVVKNLRSDALAFVEQTQHFDIEFIGGKEFFGFDLKPYAHYHDQQMVSHFMAGFLEQSKDGTGSFAKQKSDIELFLDALDSVANHIEDIMNNGNLGMQHIKQLVDLNVVTDVYPKFRISKLRGTDIGALAETISKFVTARGVHLTAEDEVYLREELGLPERDIADIEAEAEERKQSMQQIMTGGDNDGNVENKKTFHPIVNIPIPERLILNQSRGPKVTAEILALEKKVLNLAEIEDGVKTAQDKIFKETEELRNTMQTQLVSRAKSILSKAKNINDAMDLIEKTTIPGKKQILSSVTRVGKDLFRFGRQTMRDEIARQKGEQNQGVVDDPREALRVIGPSVESEIEIFANKLKGEWAAEVIRQFKAGEIDTRAITDATNRVSQNVFDTAMRSVANESFGLGRNTEMVKQGIDKAVRSEVLDTNTCGPCFDVDGLEVNVNSPEFAPFARGPYSLCEGKDNCRGLNIAII